MIASLISPAIQPLPDICFDHMERIEVRISIPGCGMFAAEYQKSGCIPCLSLQRARQVIGRLGRRFRTLEAHLRLGLSLSGSHIALSDLLGDLQYLSLGFVGRLVALVQFVDDLLVILVDERDQFFLRWQP
jgi:hypothetical protein